MGVTFLEPEEMAGSGGTRASGWWWMGIEPDEKQKEALGSDERLGMVKCPRRWGKSTIAAAKAVRRACERPGSLVLAVSPTKMESAELRRTAAVMLERRGVRFGGGGNGLTLGNGSRIVTAPASTQGLNGLAGVSLVVVDGAAQVKHELFDRLRQLQADGTGDFWMFSTPGDKKGFFYEAWDGARENDARGADGGEAVAGKWKTSDLVTMEGQPWVAPPSEAETPGREKAQWVRVAAKAEDCGGRISPEFLAREREFMEKWFYMREYEAEFGNEKKEDAPKEPHVLLWVDPAGVKPPTVAAEWMGPKYSNKDYRRGYRV